MRLSWGTVLAITEDSRHRQKLHVRLDGPDVALAEVEAINYLDVAPAVKPDERVLLNMSALDLGLGTGGVAFVVPTEEMETDRLPGHIMKLRYTPLQREVCAIEEPHSPYHELMKEVYSLEGMPVVCCSLASQVPLVAAAFKTVKPHARVILCMTDEASLLYAFSDLFVQAQAVGLIDASITCGQALGGDHEAITLHSGLLAARHVLSADMVIVSIGPGTPGSATPFGHGGVAQGEALNAVAALGGLPVAVLRLSCADARVRHQGVSHHSLITLGHVCLAKAVVPLPASLTDDQKERVMLDLASQNIHEKHHLVEVPPDPPSPLSPDPPSPLSYIDQTIDLRGLQVVTMGRTMADDPVFFAAAFAAGAHAASCVVGH